MQLTPDFIAWLSGINIGFWLGVISAMGLNWLWNWMNKRRRQEDLDWLLQDLEEMGYTEDEVKAILNRIEAMGETEQVKQLKEG